MYHIIYRQRNSHLPSINHDNISKKLIIDKTLLSDSINIGKFHLYVNYFSPQDVVLIRNYKGKCHCKRGWVPPIVAYDVDICDLPRLSRHI